MPVLASGPLKLEVLPQLGASISSFTFQNGDHVCHLMRPAPSGTDNPSDTNFLLAPYSNRIRDGAFSFQGNSYQLENSKSHAIHGDLRSRKFDVVGKSQNMVLMQFESKSVDDFNFPFSLRYRVQYELSSHKLRCVLHITNTDEKVAPVGGGFHPYFPRSLQENKSEEDVHLQFDARKIYLYQKEPLPDSPPATIPEKFLFRDRSKIREGIDHCYVGWDGEAQMSWPKTGVWMRLSAPEPLQHLVLYTPAGQDYFALEPVSNCTDAFNLADQGVEDTGIIEIAPGDSCKFEMSLIVGMQ